jgi:predicted ATP-grasp superfamily ATP-dependent carboligase
MEKNNLKFRTSAEFKEYQSKKAIADLMRITGCEGKVAGDMIMKDFAYRQAQSNQIYSQVGRIV